VKIKRKKKKKIKDYAQKTIKTKIRSKFYAKHIQKNYVIGVKNKYLGFATVLDKHQENHFDFDKCVLNVGHLEVI